MKKKLEKEKYDNIDNLKERIKTVWCTEITENIKGDPTKY